MWKTYLRTIHKGFQHYFAEGEERPACGRKLLPQYIVTPMQEPQCQKCKERLAGPYAHKASSGGGGGVPAR